MAGTGSTVILRLPGSETLSVRQLAMLGVDIGTSSSKGVLVGQDGAILRIAVREHRVDRPAPGHVEMDAAVWWEEFVAISGELLAPGDAEAVAVGVSGMGPCVLLTEDDGTPVRPAILYGVDTRAGAQIAALTDRYGEDEILERGGSVLTSQAAGPKIQWVRENEPEVYARARRLFMPASYLAFRLTGAYVLDHHSASQSSPLYDSRRMDWHRPWSDEIAAGIELPALRWPGDAAGVVTDQAASQIPGLSAGIPVITGTIDAWSEAISVDAQHPGDLMLMYGTTMFLVATTDAPATSRTMWGTAGAAPGTFSLAGGMATSGAITSWLRDLTGGAPYGELLEEAARSGPGANGLLMLPYFAGERTPIQDPDARGAIVGLTLSHTRGDLYRAALEAIGFGVRHNIETMREAGIPIERVVAVGGGTQGGLWTGIVCDITGIDQVIPTCTIGASYGAAVLAAKLVREVDISAWNPPRQTQSPDPAVRELYDELYAQYRALHPATREIQHFLAGLQSHR